MIDITNHTLIEAARTEAITSIIVGVFALLLFSGTLVALVKFATYSASRRELNDIERSVSVAIIVCLIFFGGLTLANLASYKTWQGVFYPEIYLAGKVLNKGK